MLELTTKYLFKHRAPFNLNDYRVEYDNVTYKDVTNSSVTGTVTR